MNSIRATITSVAHFVPLDKYTNDYFAERLDTTDEWIRSRTGIIERRIATSGATSDLIVGAAFECIAARDLTPRDIDCIIVATITPDHFFPSTAAIVQQKLGAKNAWGFDLSAACSGFVFGLITAAKLVESGAYRRVLLCGADKMSSITNYEDRTTAVLFGDAAGVVLVEPSEDPELGIMDHLVRMDGDAAKCLQMPAGGSFQPSSHESIDGRRHFLVQDGQVVFKVAVAGMASITAQLLERTRLTTDNIDWFVPHQANRRIIEAVAKRLGMSLDKVMINVDRYGNTCAATIPSCLSEWHQNGKLQRGDNIVLSSFGAGWTAGSIFLKWSI